MSISKAFRRSAKNLWVLSALAATSLTIPKNEVQADIVQLNIDSEAGVNGFLGNGFPVISIADSVALEIQYDPNQAVDSNPDPLDSNFMNNVIQNYSLTVGDISSPVLSVDATAEEFGNLGSISIDSDTNLDTVRINLNDFTLGDQLEQIRVVFQVPTALFEDDGIDQLGIFSGGTSLVANTRNVFFDTTGGSARARFDNIESGQVPAVPAPGHLPLLALAGIAGAMYRRRELA